MLQEQFPKLNDSALLRQQAYINGTWVGGAATFAVTNPADGATIASVPDLGAGEAQDAIAAAAAAFPAWAAKTGKERAGLMRKWFDLMLAHADDLAAIMTAEQGKPLAEAKGEVAVRRQLCRMVRRGSQARQRRRTARPPGATSAWWCSSSRSACAPRSRPGISRSR